METDGEGYCTTAVSFYGSWCSRGWSARDGVVAGISLKTGKVLDVIHLSSSCSTCDRLEKLHSEGQLSRMEFLEKEVEPREVCYLNHDGSAEVRFSKIVIIIIILFHLTTTLNYKWYFLFLKRYHIFLLPCQRRSLLNNIYKVEVGMRRKLLTIPNLAKIFSVFSYCDDCIHTGKTHSGQTCICHEILFWGSLKLLLSLPRDSSRHFGARRKSLPSIYLVCPWMLCTASVLERFFLLLLFSLQTVDQTKKITTLVFQYTCNKILIYTTMDYFNLSVDSGAVSVWKYILQLFLPTLAPPPPPGRSVFISYCIFTKCLYQIWDVLLST